MQLLRITFNRPFDQKRFADTSFSRTNQTEQEHTGVLEVDNATLIHKGYSHTVDSGTYSELYRGELRIEGKDSPEPVVVKFMDTPVAVAALRHEANIYYQLETLQGKVIPKCYGIFEGRAENRDTAWLVLSDCGKPFGISLIRVDFARLTKIIKSVKLVHENGVQFTYFTKDNVVIREDGKLFLIDFAQAASHQCELTADIILNTTSPNPIEFGCDELYNLVSDAWAWVPSTVAFCGISIPINAVTDLEILRGCVPESYTGTEEDIRSEMSRVLKAVLTEHNMRQSRARDVSQADDHAKPIPGEDSTSYRNVDTLRGGVIV